MQPRVLGLEHFAHPTRADRLDDDVGSEAVAGVERHRSFRFSHAAPDCGGADAGNWGEGRGAGPRRSAVRSPRRWRRARAVVSPRSPPHGTVSRRQGSRAATSARASGRSSGPISGPLLSTTARSIAFSSSRTLPGQSYAIRRRIAAGENLDGCAAQPPGDLLGKVHGQRRDVLPPVAQRRHAGAAGR